MTEITALLRWEDGPQLPLHLLRVLAIGTEPENEPYKALTKLNDFGYIVSDEGCRTATEGVFVAGDCRTKAYRQIATAIADGATAALNACRYLDKH